MKVTVNTLDIVNVVLLLALLLLLFSTYSAVKQDCKNQHDVRKCTTKTYIHRALVSAVFVTAALCCLMSSNVGRAYTYMGVLNYSISFCLFVMFIFPTVYALASVRPLSSLNMSHIVEISISVGCVALAVMTAVRQSYRTDVTTE